jgi:hypothetical protein
VLSLNGLSSDKIGAFHLSNSTFTGIGNAHSSISNVTSVTYSNVTINGGPPR